MYARAYTDTGFRCPFELNAMELEKFQNVINWIEMLFEKQIEKLTDRPFQTIVSAYMNEPFDKLCLGKTIGILQRWAIRFWAVDKEK